MAGTGHSTSLVLRRNILGRTYPLREYCRRIDVQQLQLTSNFNARLGTVQRALKGVNCKKSRFLILISKILMHLESQVAQSPVTYPVWPFIVLSPSNLAVIKQQTYF